MFVAFNEASKRDIKTKQIESLKKKRWEILWEEE